MLSYPRAFLLFASLGFYTLAPSLTLAQDKPTEEKPFTPFKPVMEEIAPGKLRVGTMIIDKHERSVTFPGKVNMVDGVLEYLIVGPQGSTHEALIVTDVDPKMLNFSLLLLGVKGAGMSAPGAKSAPPGQIDDEYLKNAPVLKGDAIGILIKWKDLSGAESTTRVENWILNHETEKPMSEAPWTYTGSMFDTEGAFMAELYSLHASIIINPSALINNPRKGNNNDELWKVHSAVVPPKGTAIDIVLKLESPVPEKK